MRVVQQKKILQKIADLEKDIDELKRVRVELALSGYSSATLSSSGGSKSYTRLDLDKITAAIKELMKELTQWRSLLVTGHARPIKTIATIYC